MLHGIFSFFVKIHVAHGSLAHRQFDTYKHDRVRSRFPQKQAPNAFHSLHTALVECRCVSSMSVGNCKRFDDSDDDGGDDDRPLFSALVAAVAAAAARSLIQPCGPCGIKSRFSAADALKRGCGSSSRSSLSSLSISRIFVRSFLSSAASFCSSLVLPLSLSPPPPTSPPPPPPL